MLMRMAKESGVETPTIDDLIRLDRKRKGKKLSNEDWTSKTDPEAKIAKTTNGSTHLAYKPEHAVDLDTGAIVAAPIHEADQGDTTTLEPTLRETEKNLSAVGLTPTQEEPCDLVADKGYHSPDVLKGLDNGPWKTRLSEPRPSQGHSRRHAPRMATRSRKRSQTLPCSCRGLQSRHSDARAVRSRRAEGSRQCQIDVPVHHSGRRYDRLRDHCRVRRGDGRPNCRCRWRSPSSNRDIFTGPLRREPGSTATAAGFPRAAASSGSTAISSKSMPESLAISHPRSDHEEHLLLLMVSVVRCIAGTR